MNPQQLEDMLDRLMDHCFRSPNEFDRNGEPANMVDGLYLIGRGLNRIADCLEQSPLMTGKLMVDGCDGRVAEAVELVAQSLSDSATWKIEIVK